ncbi:MAG: hypothetical protein ACI9R3_004387 [Verrucomicrobiales bacterium]|jgi:hypothetical protein
MDNLRTATVSACEDRFPMKRSNFHLVLLATIACAATSCAPSKPDSVAAVEFSKDIKPLLVANCLPCHHSETLFGRFNLETRDLAFRASESGTPIVPGNPNASLLYTKTDGQHGEQADVMPADGVLLNEIQRDWLRRWIKEGAKWPVGAEGKLTPLKIEPGEA